jgi:hypothetical protein
LRPAERGIELATLPCHRFGCGFHSPNYRACFRE